MPLKVLHLIATLACTCVDAQQLAGTLYDACLIVNSGVQCWGWMAAPSSLHIEQLCTASSRTASGLYNVYSCGVKIDHTLSCWGDDPDESGVLTPPFSTSTEVNQVVCGTPFACAILSDKQDLRCWGRKPFSSVPEGQFVVISCNVFHCCAISVLGQLVCFGTDTNGEVSGAATVAARRFATVTAGYTHMRS